MRVFVTGGTGYVGSAVVEAMLRHGHDVTCLVHRKPPPAGARAVKGDVRDASTLDLAGHDAVAHLVAVLRPPRGSSYEEMHVAATRNLLDAAERAGARRFLHMSANGVGPGGDGYSGTKWRAEEAVRASGLDWTVFRPSFIAGPGGFDAQWADIARRGPLPGFGKGDFEMQPVARDDVAEAFARALVEPKAVGKVYPMGGPERFTFAEYRRRLLRKLGIRRPVLPVPKWAARAGVASLQWVPTLPATTETLDLLFRGNVVDDDAWTRDLGIRPRTWDEATEGLAPAPRSADR